MERVRPPQSAEDSTPETMGPLPSTHSLNVLLDVVRAPGVVRTDVDALLQGLARPLAENESLRSRADFLLSLLESHEVGDMLGNQGMTVRDFAVQCLLDMGYPYALEIPPEALRGRRKAGDDDAERQIPIPGLISTLAGFITQALTAAPPVLDLVGRRDPTVQGLGLMILLLLLSPACLSVLGGALRMKNLQRVGTSTMMITGLIWMIILALQFATTSHPLSRADTYVSLVAGLGFLLGAYLTRSPGWLAPAGTPEEDETA